MTTKLRKLHEAGARSVTTAIIYVELLAKGAVRIGHLADAAGVGRSNIGVMIDTLERRGTVKRTRVREADARETWIELTPEGRELLKEVEL